MRFADQLSAATRLVLMTDGLLLAELTSDPELRRYDTVIVDEAHERSLNVDLLLGVLKRLLPRRPELKVIVTSATLAVDRVSRFFDDAPILQISGRGHPIEVRYAAAAIEPEETDLPTAVLEAYQDIATTPGAIGNGDVLVFLPGEREIRDVAELLERELSGVDVLPLYSRLSWEQQSRIFKRGARRRIVLSTNVAETSITVPGIRAVIDSGLARISRYSPRSRLQRLPIEPVSRASADQRKGRCGRIGAGLCLRLYSQAGLRGAPGVHRARDPAHQSRGAAVAPGRGRVGRCRDISLHRCAGHACVERRLPAAAGAAGVERGTPHHGPGTRDGATAPGSAARARTARKPPLQRRNGAPGHRLGSFRAGCAPAQSGPDPGRGKRGWCGVRGFEVGIQRAGEAVARLPADAGRAAARASALVQGAASVVAAIVGMGGRSRAGVGPRPGGRHRGSTPARELHRRCIGRCWRGSAPRSACAGRRATTSERGESAFTSFPDRRCGGASPDG